MTFTECACATHKTKVCDLKENLDHRAAVVRRGVQAAGEGGKVFTELCRRRWGGIVLHSKDD